MLFGGDYMRDNKPRHIMWRKLFKREFIPLYLMALPAFTYLLIFHYAPMVGILIAFQKFDVKKGFFGSPFVGLKNFEFLFATTDAFNITRNTVLYNLAYISTGMVFAVALAIVISLLRTKRTGKVYQTIYMLPYFLSWAAVGIATDAFLVEKGVLSKFISAIVGETTKVNWYNLRSFWPPFLVFMKNWKELGYSVVLYLAIISGIPAEYYEAAMMDGASKWKQVWHITIPHMRFIISISLILAMRGIVNGDFSLHYIIPNAADNGFLYPVIDIIDTYVYRGLMKAQNIGMSAAVGMYQAVIGMFMMLFINWTATKIDPEVSFF